MTLSHDPQNALLQICARDSGKAGQRRFHTEFAGLQNTLGIDASLAARCQDSFVARAFTLFHQARSQPPNQRVKPEDRLNQHVYRRYQIVSTTYVAKLVRENGIQVGISEVFRDSFGPDQNGPSNPENPWLERCPRPSQFDLLGHPYKTLQSTQGFHFASSPHSHGIP